MKQDWAAIAKWYKANAVELYEKLRKAKGATERALSAFERELGLKLPADLRAHFERFGGGSGGGFFEYEGLPLESIRALRVGLLQVLANGDFKRKPRELKSRGLVLREWWNPLWIPIVQDGGGNQTCVDLAPGPKGKRGQVIGWEMGSGPIGPYAPSLAKYVRWYRQELEGGGYVYDRDSGILHKPG